MTNKTSTLLASVSIILWCFSGICFRKGSELIGSMTYLSMMTLFGSITAVLIHLLTRQKLSDLFKLPLKVIISGFFGITVYTIILAAAFAIAEPKEIGLINLINYLWPVWMVIFELLFFKSRPKFKLLFWGIILSFAGLTISNGIENIRVISEGSYLPHLMALAGGMLWALYSVLLKWWKVPDENSGTVFHFLICALLALLLSLFSGEFSRPNTWSGTAIFWMLFGGIGPVGIAYYLWELGIKNGSISFLATLSYFIPIGSSIVISLFYSQAFRYGLIPGAVLITTGVWFVRKANKENNFKN